MTEQANPEIYQGYISRYPPVEREGPEPDWAALVEVYRAYNEHGGTGAMYGEPFDHADVVEVQANVDTTEDMHTMDEEWAEEMYAETYQTCVPSIFDDDMMDMLLQWYAFDHRVQHHTFYVKEDQTSECCPICLDPYGTSPSTRLCTFTQCGHHFCCNCLNDDYAARMKNSCAMCRQPMYQERTDVTLAELLEFAYELNIHLYELLPRWTRYYGRYETRWYFRYVGAQPSLPWPHEGPWNGSRAFTTLKRLHCHCTERHT